MGASPNQLSPRGTGLGNLFSPSTSHARRNWSNRNNRNTQSNQNTQSTQSTQNNQNNQNNHNTQNTRNTQNNQVGSLPYSAQANSISLNEG